MTEIWFLGCTRTPRTCHQRLWCSWSLGNFVEYCMSRVYRYNPETKSFHHFSHNKNPTRALNYLTQMLLAINDAFDRWKSIHVCVWRFRVASCKFASLKSIRFLQKKVRFFSNRVVYIPVRIHGICALMCDYLKHVLVNEVYNFVKINQLNSCTLVSF